MRQLITRLTARQIVAELCETGNLLRFIDRCMSEASWYGMYSYYNRSLFQGFIKEALEERGLTHVSSRENILEF